jgi:hypothetical protein
MLRKACDFFKNASPNFLNSQSLPAILKSLPIIFIFLFLAGCEKNNSSSQLHAVKYDSVVSTFIKTYFIDLDKDNTNDVAIQWTNSPLQENITTYKTWPLHSGLKIHVITQHAPICMDTTYYQTLYTTLEKNCTSSTPIRIDTFIATPNLSLELLSNTNVTTTANDSFLIYKNIYNISMPSPGAKSSDLHYGFFHNTNTGNLLFMLNGKRIGLSINKFPAPLHFDNIIYVD